MMEQDGWWGLYAVLQHYSGNDGTLPALGVEFYNLQPRPEYTY